MSHWYTKSSGKCYKKKSSWNSDCQ